MNYCFAHLDWQHRTTEILTFQSALAADKIMIFTSTFFATMALAFTCTMPGTIAGSLVWWMNRIIQMEISLPSVATGTIFLDASAPVWRP